MREKERMTAKKRRQKRIRRYFVLFICAFIVIVSFVLIMVIGGLFPKVKKELTLEAGSEAPTIESFLERGTFEGEIVEEMSDEFSMNKVGDYQITWEIKGEYYSSILHIVDTVKPVVSVEPTVFFLGTDFSIEDMAISVEDQTSTKISYEDLPDLTTEGEYQIVVVVVDEGGNETRKETTITVVRDDEAPVIDGVQDITMAAGETISYKRGVTVSDNYDKDVELEIDNSNVDLYNPGDYEIVYKAVDKAGNKTVVKATVHVTMPTVDQLTEELIYAWADERLAKIITDGMSDYDKAEAIFRWVHDDIAYNDGDYEGSWMKGAYYGLVKRSGDCYVYAMTSKVLLTRAGIKNMDIEKIPSTTKHYWNLIDLGDGWYHFDATRRKDGTEFFYVSDEDLLRYSDANKGSHNYNPANYPKIQ